MMRLFIEYCDIRTVMHFLLQYYLMTFDEIFITYCGMKISEAFIVDYSDTMTIYIYI